MRNIKENITQGVGIKNKLELYNRILYDGKDIGIMPEQLISNMSKFFNELERDKIYSLIFKLKGGYDTWYNIAPKIFYTRDMGLEKNIFKTVIRNSIDMYCKYGVDNRAVLWVYYYKNYNVNKVSDKMISNIRESHKDDNISKMYEKIFKHHLSNAEEHEHQFEFSPLKRIKRKNSIFNTIGVFDIETFKDKNSKLIPYAFGYKLSGKDERLIYITDYKDSNEMLRDALLQMFSEAETKTVLYAHNMGRFDGFLIMELMFRMKKEGLIDINIISNNNIIKRINIEYKGKILKMLDSYLVIQGSLRKLCSAFNVGVPKSYFPHDFVTHDKFNYIGEKPNIGLYEDISEKEYNMIPETGWVLRDECFKYLIRDLRSLLEVLTKFRQIIKDAYEIDITRHPTISSLALRIYIGWYYEDEMNVKIIKGNVYKDIKRGFYGGKVEVYKPKGGNKLYYYDVNSLYPYSMLKPMPVGNPKIKYFKTPKSLSDIDAFGFMYAHIKSPKDMNRPILPVRTEDRIINPLGAWSGMYFSEELRQAEKFGYDIKVEYMYEFEKKKGVFKDYVLDNYKKKKESEGPVRLIYKLLLNALFGRFGMQEYMKNLVIVNEEELWETDSREKVEDVQEVGGLYLLTVDSKKSSALYEEDIEPTKDKVVYNRQSIPIAAAITAYSRIYMNEIIGNEDYNVYYTDTDSIVLDKELQRSKVSGTKIGKFKKEHVIQTGYFIKQKVYYMELDKDKKISKFSGSNTKLTREMVEKVITKETEILNTNEIRTYREVSKGVSQKNIDIRFSTDLNTREKVYKDGVWVDTKPYII